MTRWMKYLIIFLSAWFVFTAIDFLLINPDLNIHTDRTAMRPLIDDVGILTMEMPKKAQPQTAMRVLIDDMGILQRPPQPELPPDPSLLEALSAQNKAFVPSMKKIGVGLVRNFFLRIGKRIFINLYSALIIFYLPLLVLCMIVAIIYNLVMKNLKGRIFDISFNVLKIVIIINSILLFILYKDIK